MMEDDPRIDPAVIRQARFSGSFRRYDAKAVDDFLESIAERVVATNDLVDSLRRELHAAQSQPPPAAEPASPFEAPDLTTLSEDELVGLIGAETTHVLTTARQAAADIRSKAEESAGRVIREATAEAARVTDEAAAEAEAMRAEASTARDTAVAAAEAEAERVRSLAAAESEEVVAAARAEAEAITASAEDVRRDAENEAARIIEAAKDEGRAMVVEAKKVRSRVLEDLQRRRDLGRSQVERLAAGRDQLLDAYAAVRTNLDEITSRLEAGLLESGGSQDPLLEDGFAGIVNSAIEEDTATAETASGEETEEPPAVEEPPTVEESAAALPEATSVAEVPAEDPAAEDPAAEDPAAEDTAVEAAAEVADEAVHAEAEDLAPPADDEGDDQGDVDGDPDLDALFAKIRADRAESVARAQRVLSGDDAVRPAPLETAPVATVSVATDFEEAVVEEADAAPAVDASGDLVPTELLADVDSLERRAAVIDPLDKQLSRALKRHLSDEQNVVLDVLRRSESTDPDDLLPPLDEHVAGYAAVAAVQLAEAARSGAGSADTDVDVTGLADELGASLIESFRRRIERSAADVDGEADALDERLRALYREWKVEHIGAVTADSLLSAYALGQHAGAPAGAGLRWLIDPDQGPCPDAQDNALAGAITKGDVFPTGDACPQAHPGCRCLLAVDA